MRLAQEFNIKCSLKCKYNWLKKENSAKTNRAYLRGVYKCIYCLAIFELVIENENDYFKIGKQNS